MNRVYALSGRKARSSPSSFTRQYSSPCSSSSSSRSSTRTASLNSPASSSGASSSAAPPSTAASAYARRKALKMKRSHGQAVSSLTSRRISLLRGSQSESSSASPNQQPSSSASVVDTTTAGPISDFLDKLRAPSNSAFSPVHVYPPQLALHRCLTPSHMPLPIPAGTEQYKAPRNVSTRDIDSTCVSHNVAQAVRDLRQHVAKASATPSLGWTSPLEQHNELKAILESVGKIPVSSSSEHAYEPFDPFRHNSALLDAEHNWDEVLHKMDEALTPETLRTSAGDSQSAVDLRSAIDDVDALLASLELKDSRSMTAESISTFSTKRSPRHLAMLGRIVGARRRSEILRNRVGRWNMQPRAILERARPAQEFAYLDSVKRKRRKKISKHKYKKRRKATRAERKRLGK